MTYKCTRCGNTTDNPEYFFESDTGWGGYPCGCGGDYVEAGECLFCEEAFDADEKWLDFFPMTDSGDGYCRTCLKLNFSVNVGKKYLCENNLLENFSEFCMDDFSVPTIIEKAIKYILEDSEAFNDDESFLASLWEYVDNDLGHFAYWYYKKEKGEKQ